MEDIVECPFCNGKGNIERKILEEKKCPICDKIFKQKQYNQKYCSHKCKNKRRNDEHLYYNKKSKIGNLILVTRHYKY